MMSLGSVHTQAFDGLAARLGKLNLDCQRAQRAGLGRLVVADGAILNEARRHLEQHQSHIDNLHAEIRRMQIRDWFPKKLKKQHVEWLQNLEIERKWLETVIESITPPEPLVDRPEAAKLNMFVSGLNSAATVAGAFASQLKA
jgi:HAMP domain-containing protein